MGCQPAFRTAAQRNLVTGLQKINREQFDLGLIPTRPGFEPCKGCFPPADLPSFIQAKGAIVVGERLR